jgi:hypothetical protein
MKKHRAAELKGKYPSHNGVGVRTHLKRSLVAPSKESLAKRPKTTGINSSLLFTSKEKENQVLYQVLD